MQPQTIDSRVERLEQRVTVLEQLPARMDALEVQVSQLRDEMHAEFSATRMEMRGVDERLSTQMRVLHEEVLARLTLIGEAGPRPRKRSRR